MNQRADIKQRSVFLSTLAGVLLLYLPATAVADGGFLGRLSGGDGHSLANSNSLLGAIADRVGHFGWGSNQSGQVGNPSAGLNRYFPIWTPYQPWWLQAAQPFGALPLAVEETPVQVASGVQHSVALQVDGTVWTSGHNAFGQLGDGTQVNRDRPVQVVGLSGVIAVAAGDFHSLAVTADGQVWAWGRGEERQLGHGSTDDALDPVRVVVADGSPLTGVVAVAASEIHSVALKRDGTVWAWGDNKLGQLGTGSTLGAATAQRVPGLADVRVISAGGDLTTARTLAWTGDGTLWGWGNNANCQMGEEPWDIQNTPRRLTALSRLGELRALESGVAHGVALTADGQVWTWGNNRHGQLGDGAAVQLQLQWTDETPTYRCEPLPVADVSPAESIGAGAAHTLVTRSDGTVWTWGKNEKGQLGDGSATDSGTPKAVRNECGLGQLSLIGERPTACGLILDTVGAGTVVGDGLYAAGDPVTLTATPAAGHVFMGWEPAPCAPQFAMPAQALVCTAEFTADSGASYPLTVASVGVGAVAAGAVAGGGAYAAGATVALTATPAAGSAFIGWYPTPCAARFAMPAAPLTCTAAFAADDPATRLITHYYVSILERAPDDGGLAHWLGLIADRQAQGLDVKPVFRWMASFFFNSPEYLERNTSDRQFTTHLYWTFFQRAPDDGGIAFWLARLAEGVTRDDVMAGFLYSPEFTAFMEVLGF